MYTNSDGPQYQIICQKHTHVHSELNVIQVAYKADVNTILQTTFPQYLKYLYVVTNYTKATYQRMKITHVKLIRYFGKLYIAHGII